MPCRGHHRETALPRLNVRVRVYTSLDIPSAGHDQDGQERDRKSHGGGVPWRTVFPVTIVDDAFDWLMR